MLLLVGIIFFLRGLYFIILNIEIILEYVLFNINSVNFNLFILLDYKSLLFARLVLIISSIVIFYRERYIVGDINLGRFIILVLLFIFSILFMIFMPGIVRILLGWDGLGLVSFCLVIYYKNNKSYNSGMLVVLSNRVGDVFIIIAICWMLNFGRFRFINYLYYFKINDLYQYISLLVILAAITKSAQIPFSSWLPAAIAAPTPVSALVHSSTLVTAGVYLLIRFRELIEGILIFKILMVLRGMTIFISGVSANYEYDIKKIIALSTLRQLGLIIRILCLGESNMRFFHLIAHAMFKALLFMCAGIIIHNILGIQDIRIIGNLVMFMPLTGGCFLVSNLALGGIPFMSGFYSKDLILDRVNIIRINFIIWLLFFISTGLTMRYTIRILYYVICRIEFSLFYYRFEDNDMIMFYRIILLRILRVVGGCILSWLILSQIYIIYMENWLKLIITVVLCLGVLIGVIFIYISINIFSIKFLNYLIFLNMNIWFLVVLRTWGINKYFLNLINLFNGLLEKGWNEYLLNFKIINYLDLWSKNNFIIIVINLKIYLFMIVYWFILLYFLMLIWI